MASLINTEGLIKNPATNKILAKADSLEEVDIFFKLIISCTEECGVVLELMNEKLTVTKASMVFFCSDYEPFIETLRLKAKFGKNDVLRARVLKSFVGSVQVMIIFGERT